MRSKWAWIPFVLLCFFAGLALYSLMRGDDAAPLDRMAGKPVPDFTLPQALPEIPALTSAKLRDGQPKLVNIFASWCVPCAAEAGELERLKASGIVIYGIAIRDKPEDLEKFLAQNGNPFAAIGSDMDSHVQLAFGSKQVPETFVIDGKGVIRRHIKGVITPGMVPGLVAEMKAMQ